MTPNDPTSDPAADLDLDLRPGWRSRPRAAAPPRHGARVALLAALALLHAWLVPRLLQVATPAPPASRAATPLWVEWIAAAPPPPPPSPSSRVASPSPARPAPHAVAASRPAASRPAARARRTPASASPDAPRAVAAPAAPARLFRADGSIALPAAVLDDLAQATRADRPFAWRLPGVEEALAFAHRPPPLEYVPTRFDAAWADPKDLLSEALEKAVEKTTATIKIPIPGHPGSKVVCKVSLLAVGGSCGIVNLSDGYFVALDDPATLDAREDRQCQGWWNELVATQTYEAWRALMDRYHAQCRKPRAAPDSLPSAPPPAPQRTAAAS